MSKAVSMIIFDGTLDSLVPIRKFVGDVNLLEFHIDNVQPIGSYVRVMSGERPIQVQLGETIVRKADGTLNKRRKRRVRGYAEL